MNPQEPKANNNFGKWLSNLLPKFIFVILVFIVVAVVMVVFIVPQLQAVFEESGQKK